MGRISKKIKKSTLRTQLKNWSKAVRARDGNKCFLCGSTEHLQAHHILPKHGWKEYRLDENNGICLCARCHSFGKWSVHNGASLFFFFMLMLCRPLQFCYLKNIVLKEYEKKKAKDENSKPAKQQNSKHDLDSDDDGSEIKEKL